VDGFTQAIGLKRYAIYVFDYGAPIGFRLALAHPERIKAIISQNGNAYEEGLSQGSNPIQKYWKEPTETNRTALRDFLKPETTKFQYVHGVSNEMLLAPESYTLDSALLARPGFSWTCSWTMQAMSRSTRNSENTSAPSVHC
jgi:pimeloyl-ACP methyl ester carboxylesterase